MKAQLARVRAALTKNKAPLALLGVAAVAAIAWRSRSRSSRSAGAARVVEPGPVTAYSAGGQVAGASGYDSSASDVYNAIQPQIEALSNQLDKIQQSPIPVPVPDPVPAPDVDDDLVSDPRRSGIAGFYETILKRQAGNLEVNYWDATGKSLDEIRQGIVNSPEAQGR